MKKLICWLGILFVQLWVAIMIFKIALDAFFGVSGLGQWIVCGDMNNYGEGFIELAFVIINLTVVFCTIVYVGFRIGKKVGGVKSAV